MPLSEFIGRAELLGQVRRLVAEGGAKRTLVLAGPEGIGKTTLAVMIGLALNCTVAREAGDFCGVCASCAQAWRPDTDDADKICAPWRHIAELTVEASAYRAAEVKTNPREAAPLRIAPHPAIRMYPADGDALTMAQARALIHQTQLQPDPGRCWTLIVPDLDRARWTTQAALLKTLEEPPPGVALIVLARNPLALLPTVRSRALVLTLAPLPTMDLAQILLDRKEAPDVEEARLRAALAGGCPGRALGLDSTGYRDLRAEALQILESATQPDANFTSVFRLSESLRTGKEKFESLSEILYSVMQDIVYLQSGFSEAVRNVDCLASLQRLASRLTPGEWADGVHELDRVQAAQSRNVFRPLALDSWALQLRRR